jgi:hypothetical protein
MSLLTASALVGELRAPVRSQITAAIQSALQQITQAHGYLLDIGALVIVGQSRGYAGEAPVIYLTPGRETIDARYGSHLRDAEYAVLAIVDRTAHEAPDYMLIDIIAGEVARALAGDRPELRALCESVRLTAIRPGYAEAQGNIVGVELTYQVRYNSAATSPHTAL